MTMLTQSILKRARYAYSLGKSVVGLRNPKVFCIGRNKTGTTSLAELLKNLGYRVGRQRTAELLMEDWGRRDFRRIIKYCHSADAFQDVPFSLPYTFQAVDAAFPRSRFILSVRTSADEWYQSVTRFQALRLERRIGQRRLPTAEDLKNDPYVYTGWSWRNRELTGFNDERDPYPEQKMKSAYDQYNESVHDYFRHREKDLLVLNVSEPNAMRSIYEFLGHQYNGEEMPHLNKSK